MNKKSKGILTTTVKVPCLADTIKICIHPDDEKFDLTDENGTHFVKAFYTYNTKSLQHELYFSKDALNIKVICHECSHLVLEVFRKLSFQEGEIEEAFATLLGEVCSAVVPIIIK